MDILHFTITYIPPIASFLLARDELEDRSVRRSVHIQKRQTVYFLHERKYTANAKLLIIRECLYRLSYSLTFYYMQLHILLQLIHINIIKKGECQMRIKLVYVSLIITASLALMNLITLTGLFVKALITLSILTIIISVIGFFKHGKK